MAIKKVLRKYTKQLLGELPFTAELYWQLRQQGKPLDKRNLLRGFSLHRTAKWLPDWVAQAQAARENPRLEASGSALCCRNMLIFTTLRYWIEHAALLGVALSGLGNQVTLAYLPYGNWQKPISRFDLRRQNIYAQSVLQGANPVIRTVSWLDLNQPGKLKTPKAYPQLPKDLVREVKNISERDVQYTLQVEQVDRQDDLYRLRLDRNLRVAASAFDRLPSRRPEVVITPNGSILEMGVVYQVARHFDIPVVTYEFGEQRGRIWLAQNGEVMRQETDALWQSYKDIPLTRLQWEQARGLYASRQQANLWENFSRRWQGLPTQGGEKVRQALGLSDTDQRPVVLLAANVIGDSLTLGRQVFTSSMTEWLERAVRQAAQRPEAHFVIRVHPGERYTKGPSVADLVKKILRDLPPHMHLVAAGDPINTYDLIEIADLGLVYTTTVGMEMAMSGVPVIVVGQTHYRGKGFTLDPDSWESYDAMFEKALRNVSSDAETAKNRLSQPQVDMAWNYAYRFYFDYPLPFPWHLLHFWDELKHWSVEKVLSTEGLAQFGESFDTLTNVPRRYGRTELLFRTVPQDDAGAA